jgi:hypothetical protein
MQATEIAKQPAQARRSQKKQPAPLSERLAYTPGEFASLCGKHPVWGYRRIYAGDVKAISSAGNMLIPRAEVDRFLNAATIFNPKQKAGK